MDTTIIWTSIWTSRIPLMHKLLCQGEVAKTVASWAWFRARHAASGASPWQDTA